MKKTKCVYSSKAHILNVIQFINDTLPSPSAVDLSGWITSRRCGAICTAKPIGQNLIDNPSTPLRSGCCIDRHSREEGKECEETHIALKVVLGETHGLG